ncbi:MAG: 16S rRNA (uracil(1498)-N(3))-methyltransferase [Candidatus Hydrogenedentes bacterium]|nr:16S rRNA (uracil(1498)-N(3))-methyltransferase [Candidatus Hydrogenedentota bacterium]
MHVVRARVSDEVALFDGKGHEWLGIVASLGRHEVHIDIRDYREVQPPATRVTLLQATLNNQKAMEELIRRCTEVGVTRFVFFPARHSERRPMRADKWERIAIEACKQCGRLWLPAFQESNDLEAALSVTRGLLYVATQQGDATPLILPQGVKEVTLLVGPEGDFADNEIHAILSKGALPMSLGEATYRSEVAAFLAAALVLYELGGLGPRSAASKSASNCTPPQP